MRYSVNGRSEALAWMLCVGVGLAVLMLAALAQPAAAQLHAPNIEVDEGEVAVFKFTLPRDYSLPVRYAYKTRDGTARKGRHYVAKEGHVVFPVGTRNAEVRVQTRVSYDAVTRTFKLVLSDRQVFWGPDNDWSAAWAIIYANDIPQSKTINARIRDTIVGETGPE